jgi:hypothetical protein
MIIAPDAEQKKDNLLIFLVTLCINMILYEEEGFSQPVSTSIQK